MRSIPASLAPRLPRATLLGILWTLVAVPVADPAAGQEEPGALRVSREQFHGLRWLEGTWRGGTADGRSFYERYTLVDDSTFAVESFADSTLAVANGIGGVTLRGGAVYREEVSGQRVPVTRLDGSGVRFGATARGFTWAPTRGGGWTATIHRTRADGARADVVYRMERLPDASDRAAVERAVLDYVEALYRVDPARVERSVHPRLAKVGFSRRGAAEPYREMRMTYEQLRDLAAQWNRAGRVDPAAAVKEITVFDVQDQTAAAKLTADWGTDYLHLARYDGRWQIVNVLWQSPPAR